MKAINDNIVAQNRTHLENVIPLETPFTVAIDPSNLCNFRCDFCAIQSLNLPLPFRKQLMSLELFKKIVDDFTEFPDRLKVLRINGQGEPLLNPYLPEMLTYAKEREIADFIEIITNGSKLNPVLNQRLIDSGIDRIRISVEALNANGYLSIAHTKIDFENFVNNIEDLYRRSGKCEIYIKTVDVSVPEDADKEKFFSIFGNICDRIFIDNVIPMWSDFNTLNQSINLNGQGVHGQKLQNVKICPFPFYSLIVNSDGEVTACCSDWKRKFVIGNLKQESMRQIWNGDQLRKFWIEMLKGNKDKFEMCQKCLLPVYDCNDNIDLFSEKILARLSREEQT